jgi:hypothetical protein
MASDAREFKIKITTVADTSGAQAAARDLDGLSEKTKAYAKQLEAQDTQIAHLPESWQKASDAGTDATRKVGEGIEELGLRHKDLHAAVRSLGLQFPELAEFAHLALNPVGLTVAGIAGAFALWKMRVDELTRSLGGVELPNVDPQQIGHITAMATAYEQLAKAVGAAAEKYHSVDAASDRAIAKIKEQTEEEKKLLAALKGKELADLEAQKGGMSPDQYAAARGDIEQRYGAAGLHIDQVGTTHTLFAKEQRRQRLEADSRAKMEEAAKIHVAGPEDDAKTEATLKAQADAAQKVVEESRRRRGELIDYQGGEMNWFQRKAYEAKYLMRYGYAEPQEAMGIEDQNIQNFSVPVNRYNDFIRSRAGRNALRDRRASLTSQAAAEAGEAATLGQSIPAEAAAARQSAFEGNTRDMAAGLAGDVATGRRTILGAEQMLRQNGAASLLEAAQRLAEAMHVMSSTQPHINGALMGRVQTVEQQVRTLQQQAEAQARRYGT